MGEMQNFSQVKYIGALEAVEREARSVAKGEVVFAGNNESCQEVSHCQHHSHGTISFLLINNLL